MKFLYEIFDNSFVSRALSEIVVPDYISDNIKFRIRPYQIEAFRRYIFLDNEDLEEKPKRPYHLLYNMATGSGKTLIMAGLMLHLYQKGYRNFIFFVNSNNIILKTKDNFLNPQASKYLFNNKIVIDGKEVLIKEIDNFEEADHQNINLKFTTIQQLHIDLNNTKENSVTYEDFKDKKMVLIADEAHHLVAGTKSGNLFGSWEDTVKKIHDSNFENILLEFTATIDTDTAALINYYQDKVIFKYDLAEFRKDKYSKEINLIRSLYNEQDRIIQALILNLYRQELATSNNINLKPVILFKAKKTIKESEQNKENFHKLIDNFSVAKVEKIQKTSTVPIVQKAFRFFEANRISATEIVNRIQSNFRFENCLSANNDAEAEQNQILLNTLEDENNPIRAIFAVQKLNEGWDVLNLFDIVRLYEDRDGKDGKPGKTTLSEAQLIGRGARYYPFALEEGQDKFTRKFDDANSNDLKTLEELYYHTKEDSRYISELKKALVDSGIYEDDANTIQLSLFLKPEFKKTDFYRDGHVFFNKKIPKSFDNIKSFSDVGVNKTNYRHTLSSGVGRMSLALGFELENPIAENEIVKSRDVELTVIPKNIIRFALSQNPFFYFANLSHYFPSVGSLSNFIDSTDYLAGLEITFRGTADRLKEISHFDYLQALNGLLQSIEADIKSNSTEYEGSDFIKEPIQKVFKDKEIKVYKDSERADGQETLVANEPWYVYNANYGTSEEKKFIELFSRRFEGLNHKFDNIYLIRNEREIKIFDKLGRAFEPDFLLFCKQRDGEQMTFQVFIEPKGNHLIGHDKWKEDFLKEIRTEQKTIKIHTDTYLITAVPFYNYNNENEFKTTLENTLNE
ncbi:MAG: DEAD/DEAH box helicase family protein [Paludibacter sp.]